LIILNEKDIPLKVAFLDESGDHSLNKIDPSYPVFVLAGCIFDFDYYNNTAEPQIMALKQKYFKRNDIILRSYDIRKQKNAFNILVDKKLREAFYTDINELILSLNFTVIAAAINKTSLKNQYSDSVNPYHLCFHFFFERVIMYLGKSNEKMLLRIESRETHNDKKLSHEYELFRAGSSRFPPKETQAKLADLSFNQKTQNIAGMQLADLVAYPIGKWIMNNDGENKAFKIVEKKLHQKDGKYMGYGLKVFP